MPASRSRTEHWKDCLARIQERGGSLEISVARDAVWLPNQTSEITQPGCDVVWRVKIIRMTDADLIVEAPAAFGQTVYLKPGIDLIGAMTIGQNRWMFHTRTRPDSPRLTTRPAGGAPAPLLSLELPTKVERCTRRHFYRISTANLNLPDVQCWSLLDPSSVVAAEAANRARISELLEQRMRLSAEPAPSDSLDSILLPEVGPMFSSKLVNISGGGLGIRVNQADAAAAQHKPYLWICVDLRPHIPAPLAVTVRAAHTHLDSSQSLYLGLAFDFAFNPDHRLFVVEQFQHYIDRLQSRQRVG
ncbi:MAG: hypothetical protein AB7G11_12635 [Phycisphaerales bacterium]